MIATRPGTTNGSFMVAYGKGDGTFQTTASAHLSGAPALLSADDFDCDGQLDVLIYDQTAGQLLLFRNEGGMQGFQSPLIIDTGITVGAMAVARFDSDNKPDIALLSSAAPAKLVVLGNQSN